jgi:hypothetical protein
MHSDVAGIGTRVSAGAEAEWRAEVRLWKSIGVTHLTLANYYESGHLHRIAGRSLGDRVAAMRRYWNARCRFDLGLLLVIPANSVRGYANAAPLPPKPAGSMAGVVWQNWPGWFIFNRKTSGKRVIGVVRG